MKNRLFQVWLLFCLLAAPVALRAGDAAKPAPAIYDESADGSKQIADALALASKDGKRVLIQFGANWCIWCRRLHGLYESNKAIADTLKKNFVLVMLDMNKGHNSDVVAKYGNPIKHGIPVIVILDAAGKQLTTKDSGELEEGDHHSPVKVMAFLKEWSPGQ